jgi:hypothetical protein
MPLGNGLYQGTAFSRAKLMPLGNGLYQGTAFSRAKLMPLGNGLYQGTAFSRAETEPLKTGASAPEALKTRKPRFLNRGFLNKIRCGRQPQLLNRTGGIREDVVRVRADQPDRPHYQDQNHGQHHGIFSDVLPFISRP